MLGIAFKLSKKNVSFCGFFFFTQKEKLVIFVLACRISCCFNLMSVLNLSSKIIK